MNKSSRLVAMLFVAAGIFQLSASSFAASDPTPTTNGPVITTAPPMPRPIGTH